MELRHLRYFVAVAEEEHVTRAAARLGIQQPPLSQQIRLLEEELGVDLFERSPRQIRLNGAGKIFLSDARRVLAMVRESVERVRQFDLGREGSLIIGLVSSATLHPLTMSIIAAFRQAYPLVSLQIEEGANHELMRLVEEERLDLAFVRTDVRRYPQLACEMLVQEPTVAAIPINHPLAQTPDIPLTLDELRGVDMLFYRYVNGAGICEMLQAAFAEQGIRPRVVNETERMISALNMVAAGFGVAVVPKALEAFQIPNIVYRDISLAENFMVPLNVAHREGALTNTMRRFLNVCAQTARKKGDTAPVSPPAQPGSAKTVFAKKGAK